MLILRRACLKKKDEISNIVSRCSNSLLLVDMVKCMGVV